ncbi:MAG: PKD domain-containing protein [Chitinophagales bacterium]|nr:PKD domain-containing protein [Bacteroidota bacterium]MCB9044263.1 PKD domain-containing protein [Chitinophagales bacterium]
MKKNYALLLLISTFCGVFQFAQAQISIEAADLPQADTQAIVSTANNPLIIVGISADYTQTWDFTNVPLSENYFNLHFLGNEAPAFPFENATLTQNGTLAQLLGIDISLTGENTPEPQAQAFYSKDAEGNVYLDGMQLDASFIGFNEPLFFTADPPYRFFSVGEYNDNFTADSELTFRVEIDTLIYRIDVAINTQTQIDGFGELILPNSQDQVLRYNEWSDIHATSGFFIDIFGFEVPVPEELVQNILPIPYIDTTFQTQNIRFYAKEKNYPLATVNLNVAQEPAKPIFLQYINAPQAPLVTFEANVSCPDQTVTFANNSEGTQLVYLWDFGDGSETAQTLAPVHQFADNGTYNVALTVTDAAGQTTTYSEDVLVDCEVIGVENIVLDKIVWQQAGNVLWLRNLPQTVKSVEIFALDGKMIASKTLFGQENVSISMENELPAAMYVVKLLNEHHANIITQKIYWQ